VWEHLFVRRLPLRFAFPFPPDDPKSLPYSLDTLAPSLLGMFNLCPSSFERVHDIEIQLWGRSEAAIGVVTSLNALGLQDELRSRDLAAIRKWFIKQDKTKHIQRVFALAGSSTNAIHPSINLSISRLLLQW
jgi:hypothetical protein